MLQIGWFPSCWSKLAFLLPRLVCDWTRDGEIDVSRLDAAGPEQLSSTPHSWTTGPELDASRLDPSRGGKECWTGMLSLSLSLSLSPLLSVRDSLLTLKFLAFWLNIYFVWCFDVLTAECWPCGVLVLVSGPSGPCEVVLGLVKRSMTFFFFPWIGLVSALPCDKPLVCYFLFIWTIYFSFWHFFVLYILKFEIKIQKVPTLNRIPGSTLLDDKTLSIYIINSSYLMILGSDKGTKIFTRVTPHTCL